MKLLVLTQVVDREDTALSFFHSWLRALAVQYEAIEVICLKEGEHALPENVRIHSLGKEQGRPLLGSVTYAVRFLALAWQLRDSYDAVFVHMNQEYIVIGGLLWKLLGKRIYFWRNYHVGSGWTRIAVALSTKVFCTSAHSYTARFKKTTLMPVGIDTDTFTPDDAHPPRPGTLLSFGRIAPSKRVEVFLEALMHLQERGYVFTADVYGDALPEDASYQTKLAEYVRAHALETRVQFHPGVPNEAAAGVFREHQIFVNASPSGMYDKMIFEAAASGCLVVASSRDFTAGADPRLAFPDRDAHVLSERLAALLDLREEERATLSRSLRARAVAEHGLSALMTQLVSAIA